MRGEGGIVKVIFTITGALAGYRPCYSIFYNIMFGVIYRGGVHEFRIFDFLDIDDEIDAIQQGARESFLIIGNFTRGAGTFVGGVAKIATGAGVHGADEHKIGGIAGTDVDPRNGDALVFHGLAQSLQDASRILGELIEKEDAEVGKGNLARVGLRTATDHGRHGRGVVRGAKGARGDDFVTRVHEGVKFGDRDKLFDTGFGEEVETSLGEQSFARARRAGNEDIMMAGDGDSKSALGESLAENVIQKSGFFICFGIFYNIYFGRFDGLLTF